MFRGNVILFMLFPGHSFEVLRAVLESAKEDKLRSRELLWLLKLPNRLNIFLKTLLFRLLSSLLLAISVYFIYLLFLSVIRGVLIVSSNLLSFPP